MSRFKVGQTVYMGRGDKMRTLVVARVIKNPMIPIRQYTFEAPNDGFACGEQSIRAKIEGRDLKISECILKDKTAEILVNTMASAMSTKVDIPNELNSFKNMAVSFNPDFEFCKWLGERANGRLIIHVGSSQGHLVNMLKRKYPRTIGIEPNISKTEWLKWRALRGYNIEVNEILEQDVAATTKMINTLGKDKVLLVIACPNKYDFTLETFNIMSEGMELILIENKDNQFKTSSFNKELLEHKGSSEENVLVYSIIK